MLMFYLLSGNFHLWLIHSYATVRLTDLINQRFYKFLKQAQEIRFYLFKKRREKSIVAFK